MYTLLVVDDEYEIRNGLCNYFPWPEVGFECLGYVEDGNEAMRFLRSRHVDVLLSDIMMPTMTGIDLAMEIYNQKINTKMVFLSGYKNFEFAQQALAYGVKNYILKPTKYNELVEIFSKIKSELDLETNKNEYDKNPEILMDSKKICGFKNKIIDTIKEYVCRNYKDATLKGVADLVHMHPFYVSKIFKQNVGQNFSDFVMNMKMKKASELIMDINYKTYEVSDMVGYSNSKNFTRTFKSYYGVTPREYRNNNVK